jgi:hydroxymethylpyrimidine/phosphomethylpyrimidine kinase
MGKEIIVNISKNTTVIKENNFEKEILLDGYDLKDYSDMEINFAIKNKLKESFLVTGEVEDYEFRLIR